MKFLILSYLLISGFLLGCASKTENNANIMQDSLVSKAKELAHKFIITDGHVDLPYRIVHDQEDVSKSTQRGDFDYVRAMEGGLDVPFMSIYIPASYQKTGGAKEKADSLIDLVSQLTIDHPEKFALITSPSEARANFEKGIISFPMGMENGAPIGDDLKNVKYFHERGIRYITLTHSKDNLICDSSYDTTRTWNGLSEFGFQVVKEMNRVGIMVDVSHISDSAFYQVMAVTTLPVIASHSSCRYFTPGFERNMSDDMIKKVGENGGVVQINFGSTFLEQSSRDSQTQIDEYTAQWIKENNLEEESPKAKEFTDDYWSKNFKFSTVEKAADHIDHVVKIAGIDHVGFGSDFDGVGNSLPVNLKDVSDYPNLIHVLLKRGYTEEDIEKICYKNVFRVWEAVEEAAKEI